MPEDKRKLAMAGGLAGLVYLLGDHLQPGLPDALLGFILGIGILCFIWALLPEKAAKKVWKWKHRGK